MAKELLVHSGHQPDLRMQRSLSLSFLFLSLTLCPRVGNHLDTVGRKAFFPTQPTALGWVLACPPAWHRQHPPGDLYVRVTSLWVWGAWLGPPFTTTREDYTEGRGGRERRGEGRERGSRRKRDGEWEGNGVYPPHSLPPTLQPAFLFFNHSQRLRHQRTREWTHVKIRLHRMGSVCVCACATPWKRSCPSYLIHLSILVRRCDAALLLRQPWYTHTHTNAHAPESLACTTASSSLA